MNRVHHVHVTEWRIYYFIFLSSIKCISLHVLITMLLIFIIPLWTSPEAVETFFLSSHLDLNVQISVMATVLGLLPRHSLYRYFASREVGVLFRQNQTWL